MNIETEIYLAEIMDRMRNQRKQELEAHDIRHWPKEDVERLFEEG